MQSSMADIAESSSIPLKNKPVIVRVKRKAFHSRLDAFWLEINERPLKRPLLDFEKLSISDSSTKIKELKTKKIFVQHVETLSNLEVNIDILQSFVPDAANAVKSASKGEERRRTVKADSKQDQLLVKAKKDQEVTSKIARFEQIWRRRKGKKDSNHDEALSEMCHLYDVVRVDVAETTNEVKEQEDSELEDHRIMSSFLPLLREFIPSAASEIESEIDDYMSKGASKDDFVYDLYAVKDDITMTVEDASNPFPLVQVDDDDDGFYDGPDESENESYDSNAEDNPLNEYPDEETSSDEEETESRTSADISEEDKSSVTTDEFPGHERSGDKDFFEDEIYGADDYEYDDEDDDDDDDE